MTDSVLKPYTLEYNFNASPRMLYGMLSTSEGLNVWFADKVTNNKEIFYFTWNKVEYSAELAHKKEFEHVRFKWIRGESDKYFEFHITSDALDNETTLKVTDFAEENDMADSEMMWNEAIKRLVRAMGSRFSNINS